ncbi:MAG: CapA family protein [Anaerolineales bacterium]|nr:CapA family protein [Anaerolineales bacterium]MCB9144285.1 CapA family protein [Anaerolineales bacterium]
MKKLSPIFIIIFLIAACAPAMETPAGTTPNIPTQPTSTQTPMPDALWISPAVPDVLRESANASDLPLVDSSDLATQTLDISDAGSLWIYALVAPFPTVTDGISSADLLNVWKNGSSLTGNGQPLLMAESTLGAFTALWGEPASGAVRTVANDEILAEAWNQPFHWAIIPFEEIKPKWKVLAVDGQSPIRKEFDANLYPLKLTFGLTNAAFELPATNRDDSKMTTVVLTGVTALVRATAFTMETKGVTRPGELVYDWLHGADILHISNEVAFDPSCPYPKPGYTNFILCSDPKYFELLQYVGTDIVELTGDHFADRGAQAMRDTLKMYTDNGIPYYGGGADTTEARKPVLMEVNGNKIAFMGCNGKISYTFVKATDIRPGAADCDYEFFTQQVKDVAAQGYMVIFTFQHEECYHYGPCYRQEEGFHAVADAGSTIVSGSQAHYPHLMEFRGDVFVHFGLGNLFFDQMTYNMPDGSVIDETRREFIDRHVFYDGKYIGTELLTAMLEDFSRPRPMNERERTQFLSEYFAYSGWTESQPVPAPQPTVTLTPIALPKP